MAKATNFLLVAGFLAASATANTRLDFILAGRDMPNEDPFSGSPDMYAIVSYAPTPSDTLSEIGKTGTLDNNNNPDWPEVFNFFLYGDMQQRIKIDFWDVDYDPNDYMGYVQFPLMALVEDSDLTMDLKLSTGKGHVQIRGRVNHTRVAGTGSTDVRFINPVPMIAMHSKGVQNVH